jgi:murein L,D-transpeptidase YcbB/YkuD
VLGELSDATIASDEPLRFDAALTEALRAFQAQHGLIADGILSDRTLLSLQAEIGLTGFDPAQDGR